MRPLAITLLLLAPLAAAGQDAPPKTIDQLVAEITSIRAQKAELDKRERTALDGIKAELKRQSDLLDKLGQLDGPKPPAPPAPPVPVDPLAAKLKAAYDAAPGTSAEKAGFAKDLAALYRQAAKLVVDPEQSRPTPID